MKFYKKVLKKYNLYWVKLREIPISARGLDLIGGFFCEDGFLSDFNFLEFIAHDEQEIDFKELPEEFQQIISDPLFEIEFEKWAKKNGY